VTHKYVYLFLKMLNVSLSNVYQLYRSMEEENVILSFKGIITADLLTSVLHLMEAKMETMEESPRTRKRVFSVLVECLQNIYHHLDDNPTQADFEAHNRSAVVLISKVNNQFLIRTGNCINIPKIMELKERLDTINAMDQDGLREMYQTSLSEAAMSPKATAGLGMIDIARKSGNKLDYEFLEIDSKMGFFCLNILID
jgi:hypothetical protein